MEEAHVCVSRRVTVAHEPQRTADEILRSAFELLLRERASELRDAHSVQSQPQQERSKSQFLQEVLR
jgi:hypothetical protein